VLYGSCSHTDEHEETVSRCEDTIFADHRVSGKLEVTQETADNGSVGDGGDDPPGVLVSVYRSRSGSHPRGQSPPHATNSLTRSFTNGNALLHRHGQRTGQFGRLVDQRVVAAGHGRSDA